MPCGRYVSQLSTVELVSDYCRRQQLLVHPSSSIFLYKESMIIYAVHSPLMMDTLPTRTSVDMVFKISGFCQHSQPTIAFVEATLKPS